MLKIANRPPKGGVINVGSDVFAESIEEQGAKVYQVKWQPPAHGKPLLINILDRLEGRSDIDEANMTAIERFMRAQPVLIGVGIAQEAIPGFGSRMLLHAGPPITWGKMSGPLRGAVIGAILYEGWADSPEEAKELASKGDIAYSPCHEHSAVDPWPGSFHRGCLCLFWRIRPMGIGRTPHSMKVWARSSDMVPIARKCWIG